VVCIIYAVFVSINWYQQRNCWNFSGKYCIYCHTCLHCIYLLNFAYTLQPYGALLSHSFTAYACIEPENSSKGAVFIERY